MVIDITAKSAPLVWFIFTVFVPIFTLIVYFQLKSVVPLLLPFFKTSALYFILSSHLKEYKVLFALLKCAPIITLLMFVMSRCYVSRSFSSYRILVASGLVLSCIGDVFLVYKIEGYLIHGMIAFGIAQIIYTCAFGFRQFNGKIAGMLSAAGICVYGIMYPSLRGALVIAIPIYIVMLGCMIWRATSRAEWSKQEICIAKLSPAIGSILFMISDIVLGFSLFHGATFTGCGNVIMLTYYAAQMFIALSCADPLSI